MTTTIIQFKTSLAKKGLKHKTLKDESRHTKPIHNINNHSDNDVYINNNNDNDAHIHNDQWTLNI